MNNYIYYYLLAVNILAFVLFGIDKQNARRNMWRIPEKTLILSAVIGGSAGAILGMRFFHHKTRKAKFAVGVPDFRRGMRCLHLSVSWTRINIW